MDAAPLSAEDAGRAAMRGYKLVSYIGSGAFAEVSKYTRLSTGEVVAVKRLKKDQFKCGVNLGAVKELQALQELSHPNVLAVRVSRWMSGLAVNSCRAVRGASRRRRRNTRWR